MNINNLPKRDLNEVPAEFFESQLNSITKKTIDIENWNLSGTKDIESHFTVPEGYWLQMENGIRSQIKPKPIFEFEFSTKWKLVPVLGSFLILIFSISLFQNSQKTQAEDWNAKIEALSNDELIAGIDLESTDIQELTEKIAMNSLKETDISFRLKELDNADIDETLDNINETDLLNHLEIN